MVAAGLSATVSTCVSSNVFSSVSRDSSIRGTGDTGVGLFLARFFEIGFVLDGDELSIKELRARTSSSLHRASEGCSDGAPLETALMSVRAGE